MAQPYGSRPSHILSYDGWRGRSGQDQVLSFEDYKLTVTTCFASQLNIEACQAVKDVNSAQEALVDIFERIENFFKRLEAYTEVRTSEAKTDIIVKIMVEVLNILGIATKEIKQGRTKRYLKKLLGKTEIEDALKRLDKLTQEEVRMATAQLLRLTNDVDDKVTRIEDDVSEVMRKQWLQDLRMWFSSPDPSTNHVKLCGAQHQGTANWFFRGSLFEEWKSTGSLLWIHGKHMSFNIPRSTRSECDLSLQRAPGKVSFGALFLMCFLFARVLNTWKEV
ncbi:hypothetical protein V8E53_013195 [Lactarius tabidus]